MVLKREDFEQMKCTVTEVGNLNGNDVACIRVMSALTRDGYDASVNDGKRIDVKNLGARLVVLCLCDAEGTLLFDDPVKGAAVIGGWPTTVVEPLYHACVKLNGIGKKAIEEAAKNSEGSPADSSSSV